MQRFQKPQRGKGDVFARLAGNSFNFGEMPEVRRQQEEKQTGIADVISSALPGLVGAFKGKGKTESSEAPLEDRLQDENDVRKHIEGGDSLNGAFAQRRRGGDYEGARADYEDALGAPIKKKSGWKDALYKIATVASNMFNPQNQLPVVGLGRAQYNQNVDRAGQRFAPFQALEDKRVEYAQKQKAMDNIDTDNERANADFQRKVKADENRKRYNEGILADKKAGRELSATQIESLKEYRQWLMQNGDKMSDARIKEIDERLKDYDLDRESKLQIATLNNQTRKDIADTKAGTEAAKLDAKTVAQQEVAKRGKDAAINAARLSFGKQYRTQHKRNPAPEEVDAFLTSIGLK